MVNPFLVFVISYFLSLGGYLLGKSTKEELKEIKSKIKLTFNFLIFLSYIYLVYLVYKNIFELFFLIILIIIFYLSFRNNLIEPFHHVAFLTFSFIIFNSNSQLELFLIPIFSIFLYHSIEKWEIKNEVYKAILSLICFFFFSVVL